MWLLPISVLAFSVIVAFPLGGYLAWIMGGRYRPPRLLKWFEERVNSGPQNWKQYAVALLVFNTVLYAFGYLVLSLQPRMPLNPRGLGALAPSTIFNTVISFSTNTDIQHYSGDAAFSNFSQIFFCLPMFFLSAAIGFCALTAIIRALRSDPDVGNCFLDMWRVVFYTFLPAVFVVSIVFLIQGMPMTFQSDYQVSTLEPAARGTADSGQSKQQTIVVGPLAAFVPMKMLGTNGGGFYGMNSAHPFENPNAGANFLTTSSMMWFPMALVFMYGRMLRRRRHSLVIFSVMFVLLAGTILWTNYFDTLKPNPGLTPHLQATKFEVSQRDRAGRQTTHHGAGGGRPAGRPTSGQSGRQGTALWHFGGLDLCCGNRRLYLWCDHL